MCVCMCVCESSSYEKRGCTGERIWLYIEHVIEHTTQQLLPGSVVLFIVPVIFLRLNFVRKDPWHVMLQIHNGILSHDVKCFPATEVVLYIIQIFWPGRTGCPSLSGEPSLWYNICGLWWPFENVFIQTGLCLVSYYLVFKMCVL